MLAARFGLGLGLLVAAGAVVACGADRVEREDDGGSQGGSTPTGSGGATGAGGIAGGGTGGSPGACAIDCTTIQTPDCQYAECNPQSGQCELKSVSDDSPCDDGQFCTTNDTCQAGVCTGGPPNDCGMPAEACQEVICDEPTMSCSQQALANGTSCQPADLCITGATCANGLCVGGSPNDCFFFPVPDCHVAACNPTTGMCEAVVGNEGLPCTDTNDLCTANKTCAGGVCQGGSPKDCSQLTQDCVLGVCDTTTGQCTTQNLMNNDPCDDLNTCTTGELCQNGLCTGGTPVTACMNGDSCCPMGCTAVNDLDCAIQTMDIGPYGSTFSSTLTRGYWFTAPTNFTIKELRVPTDVGTGPQNIQVVKFLGGPPPTYTASTTNYTSLFYTNQVPGTNFIPVNIPVVQGDIIGVLGARGTSTMANSYAANSTYNTTIFGQPVTLTRLIYQGSIGSSPAGALSQSSGVYSRIELKYGP